MRGVWTDEIQKNWTDVMAQPHADKEQAPVSFEEVGAALEHISELQRSFDLMWAADQRAIKLWEKSHPGKEHVWPDRTDLVTWLLDQLEKSHE